MGKTLSIRHWAKPRQRAIIRIMLPLTIGRLVAAMAASLFACSSKDNPPPVQPCAAQSCNPNTLISSTGVGGTGGIADSGTLGVAMDVVLVSFTGSEIGPLAWSLAGVQELAGTFDVKTRTPDGSILDQTGTSPILFSNVLATNDGWVSATPGTSTGLLPALRNIPSDSAGSVSVPLMSGADFNFVPSLLSTTAMAVDYTKSQVVIKIVDVNGNGVAGLKAYIQGPEAIAYASGNSWVNDTSSPGITDSSGRVVAINLQASSQLVTFLAVSATGANLQGLVETVSDSFPIQGGFVTYGTLLFQ